jgi:ribosome-binding protein aMBF1 (putative translation factor)
MSHQDWVPIILKNVKVHPTKQIIEKRGDTSVNDNLKKIENDTENFSSPTIPNLLSKEIISARLAIKKSQKEMANKLMVQQSIYNELENGKAIYSSQTKQYINKLEKILNIKFQKK